MAKKIKYYRKFVGKNFLFDRICYNKKIAEQRKEYLKKKGKNVRIIENKEGYIIYKNQD